MAINARGNDRREILKMLAMVPAGLAFGCGSEWGRAILEAPIAGPEDALRRLLLVVGPWREAEKSAAESFVERFLAAQHLASLFLPESAEEAKSLAERLRRTAMAADEIDLRELPEAERDLLVSLVQQLYSLLEVRFTIAGQPGFGECQRDAKWYTLPPGSATA